MDMVQNPNFDSALARRNYENNLAQSVINYQTQNPMQADGSIGILPTNQAGFSGQNTNFEKSIKDAGKQIILSFNGETYGSANDKSANEIAKKYNLDIVQKPDQNSSIPVYIFSVKGEVGKSLSGIKNEQGVKYAEPNYRMGIGGAVDPVYRYEDNRMKAALAGEEIPTSPAPSKPADKSYQTLNPTIATTGSAMPQVNPQLGQAMLAAAEQQRNLANQVPTNGQNATAYNAASYQQSIGSAMPQQKFQNPQMQQMQNYNQMLQQGMQRNTEMNQAAQNFVAPAGPAKSFSQVVGRTRRTPMPRPPVNNSLAPSNRRLI